MSYSTDPVLDADRHLAERYAEQERQDDAIYGMRDSYRTECQQQDAGARATWAPLVTDYDNCRAFGVGCDAPGRPTRFQTLTEVMTESLDFTNGPAMAEAMQLILNVAHGSDLANQPAAARKLLNRMAMVYASHHAEVIA